jgi:hypothetical protein
VGRENEDLANVMLIRIQTGVASGQSWELVEFFSYS